MARDSEPCAGEIDSLQREMRREFASLRERFADADHRLESIDDALDRFEVKLQRIEAVMARAFRNEYDATRRSGI